MLRLFGLARAVSGIVRMAGTRGASSLFSGTPRGSHTLFGDLGQDVRYAVRSFARTPGFLAIAVATLALGTGVSTAIFSAVDAVVLRPLPFRQPDGLVAVGTRPPTRPAVVARMAPVEFLDLRDRQDVFSGFAGMSEPVTISRGFALLEPGRPPEELEGREVSAEFFDVLGVVPALGRAFARDEEVDGRHRVALLSHEMWRTRYGGARDVIGRRLPCRTVRTRSSASCPARSRIRRAIHRRRPSTCRSSYGRTSGAVPTARSATGSRESPGAPMAREDSHTGPPGPKTED